MRPILVSIAAVAMVIVVLKLTPVPVAGQAPTPSASLGVPADPPLKTPWGEPDLQGLWTHDSEIPLQRPAAFADREFFTDEEIAEIDSARARRLDHDYRAPVGTPNDVSGAYNAVYHLRKPTGRRTSLIIDPPDGRRPAYMPEVAGAAGGLSRVSARPPAGVAGVQKPRAQLQWWAVWAGVTKV